MIWMPRLVWHDTNVPLIDRVAAEIHLEFHFLLQHHHELVSFVISAEKLLGVVQAIDVFPAAACKRFEECRPTDVAENSFPLERIPEITECFVVRVRRRLVRREQYRARYGDADLGRE